MKINVKLDIILLRKLLGREKEIIIKETKDKFIFSRKSSEVTTHRDKDYLINCKEEEQIMRLARILRQLFPKGAGEYYEN